MSNGHSDEAGGDPIDAARAAIKEAYGAVSGYYREFEKLGQKTQEGSLGPNDMDGAVEAFSQGVMTALKAANTAARQFMGGVAAAKADATTVVLDHKGTRARLTLNPGRIPVSSGAVLWPLRSEAGAELPRHFIRLVKNGAELVLALAAPPKHLPAGTYVAPITQGRDGTMLGTVVAIVEKHSDDPKD